MQNNNGESSGDDANQNKPNLQNDEDPGANDPQPITVTGKENKDLVNVNP
jgi:hypothetical protein